MLAHRLRTFRFDVRSSDSSRNKDQKIGAGRRKNPAELMRGVKPRFSISKLFIFGCTVFMRKKDRRQQTWSQGTGRKILGSTEGDNG